MIRIAARCWYIKCTDRKIGIGHSTRQYKLSQHAKTNAMKLLSCSVTEITELGTDWYLASLFFDSSTLWLRLPARAKLCISVHIRTLCVCAPQNDFPSNFSFQRKSQYRPTRLLRPSLPYQVSALSWKCVNDFVGQAQSAAKNSCRKRIHQQDALRSFAGKKSLKFGSLEQSLVSPRPTLF